MFTSRHPARLAWCRARSQRCPSAKVLTCRQAHSIVDNRQPTPGSWNQQRGGLMGFDSKPKFVSFDMNGTLIHFRINDAIREVLGDRLPAEIADDFLQACKAYRIDECMGEWKPFHQIVGRFSWNAPAQARPGVPRGRRAGGVRPHPHLWPVPRRHRGTEPPGRGVPAGDRDEQRRRACAAPRGESQGPVRSRHQRRADGRLQATAPCVRVHAGQARRRHPTRSCTSPRARSTTSALRPSWASSTRCTSTAASSTDESWLGYERITDIADLPVLLGLPRP